MRIGTRPRKPRTMRTRSERLSRGGMKSMRETAPPPSAVSIVVSRTKVSPRYWRRVRSGARSQGAMRQRPCSGVPSRAAKQAGLSKRGQQSQSTEPSRETSAAVSQSPMSA